jgi:hypothetical protein
MVTNVDEVAAREKAALAAIRRSFGTAEGEFGANLFASHHLEEIDGAYWQKHLGTKKPEPAQVLDILILRSHWADDENDGIQVFDFTLPDEVTNYVISVRFDYSGEVEDISMES